MSGLFFCFIDIDKYDLQTTETQHSPYWSRLEQIHQIPAHNLVGRHASKLHRLLGSWNLLPPQPDVNAIPQPSVFPRALGLWLFSRETQRSCIHALEPLLGLSNRLPNHFLHPPHLSQPLLLNFLRPLLVSEPG